MTTTMQTTTTNAMTERHESTRRFGIRHRAQASVHIDAPPEAVWEVIADVTRTGEWSGEAQGAEWIDGATGAVPSARFKGSNRRGFSRWSKVCEVMSADRPHEFVYRTLPSTLSPSSTRWSIALAAENGGTRVTEGFHLLYISRLQELIIYWTMPMHRDRTSDLVGDLQRLKGVVEAGTGRPS